jgi:hypothetical protein
VLTRPDEFDVIATLNLNGDYLSDALAAQVGGIGIAPGGNINYVTGHAVFEATHGTAPKYANLDKVNPGSVILSGEMMLRYMGWTEAADAIIRAMDKAIGDKTVTYDFARLMEGATEVKCSEFGDCSATPAAISMPTSKPSAMPWCSCAPCCRTSRSTSCTPCWVGPSRARPSAIGTSSPSAATARRAFVHADGERGMVMAVFTLPSYPVVFKLIRDRFAYPKNMARAEVEQKYRLVFHHDRVGRLVDAQLFRTCAFRGAVRASAAGGTAGQRLPRDRAGRRRGPGVLALLHRAPPAAAEPVPARVAAGKRARRHRRLRPGDQGPRAQQHLPRRPAAEELRHQPRRPGDLLRLRRALLRHRMPLPRAAAARATTTRRCTPRPGTTSTRTTSSPSQQGRRQARLQGRAGRLERRGIEGRALGRLDRGDCLHRERLAHAVQQPGETGRPGRPAGQPRQ